MKKIVSLVLIPMFAFLFLLSRPLITMAAPSGSTATVTPMGEAIDTYIGCTVSNGDSGTLWWWNGSLHCFHDNFSPVANPSTNVGVVQSGGGAVPPITTAIVSYFDSVFPGAGPAPVTN